MEGHDPFYFIRLNTDLEAPLFWSGVFKGVRLMQWQKYSRFSAFLLIVYDYCKWLPKTKLIADVYVDDDAVLTLDQEVSSVSNFFEDFTLIELPLACFRLNTYGYELVTMLYENCASTVPSECESVACQNVVSVGESKSVRQEGFNQ